MANTVPACSRPFSEKLKDKGITVMDVLGAKAHHKRQIESTPRNKVEIRKIVYYDLLSDYMEGLSIQELQKKYDKSKSWVLQSLAVSLSRVDTFRNTRG